MIFFKNIEKIFIKTALPNSIFPDKKKFELLNKTKINQITLLLLSLFSPIITKANLGRHDISWTDYVDFGMNYGKYQAGRTGIIVYKKDGELSGPSTPSIDSTIPNTPNMGVIWQPIPDFRAITDIGSETMWNDSQVFGSVRHIRTAELNFGTRFYRKNLNLSSDFENGYKSKNILNKYSENYKTAYFMFAPYNRDYHIGRISTVVFDEIPYEVVKNADKERVIKVNALIARVGGGTVAVSVDKNKQIAAPPGAGYAQLTGGLNKIARDLVNTPKNTNNPHVIITLDKNPKTPLDAGTLAGDSGSPDFIWDEEKKKWYLFATNSAGGNWGYGKTSYLRNDLPWSEKKISELTDKNIINADSVTISANGETGIITNGSTTISFLNKAFNQIDVHNITKNITKEKELENAKNRIFGNTVKTITINQNINTNIARLIFKGNTEIIGTGNLNTAGIETQNGSTVTYKLNLTPDNNLRKIGNGTLIINGSGNNEGTLSLGDGLTILKQQNGYAAKIVKLGSGRATVRLTDEHQLNGNNILFSNSGGTLDINGIGLTFNDIYHLDNGAKITNSNQEKQATFIFTNNKNRVYLGEFSGNLNINYTPTKTTSTLDTSHQTAWQLRGNINIKGDITANNNLEIRGDDILHNFNQDISGNEFKQVNISAKNIQINNNSTFTIGRGSHISSNISIKNGSKLNIKETGIVLTNKPKMWVSQPDNYEKDTNKVELNGELNFEHIEDQDYNFILDTENNNTSEINSKITGTINLIKNGDGEVYFNNNENNFTGKVNITKGAIRAKNNNNLANAKYTIDKQGILEVKTLSSIDEFDTTLDKITENSTGVLSINSNLDNLSSKLSKYSHLYIGTHGNVTIGNQNTIYDKSLTTLNFGGDQGILTINGISNGNIERTLNIGNSTNGGTVILDKVNSNLKINIGKGINFNIIDNETTKKFLNLQYGSTTSYNLLENLTNDSEGVALIKNNINQNSINISTTSKAFIGADANHTVNINNIENTDKYRLSGNGITNINFSLANKDLIIDGEYLTTGRVILNQESNNYTGNIVVQGNRDKIEDKGNITLELNTDKPLGENNDLLVRNGGILNLKGHNLTINMNTENDKKGTLLNTLGTSTLTIINVQNIDINNRISSSNNSNLNINYIGNNEISLKNPENNFTGTITLSQNGTYLHTVRNSIGKENILSLNGNSQANFETSFDGTLNLNSNQRDTVKLNNTTQSITINKVILNKNSEIIGRKENKNVKYNNLELMGNELTLTNQDIEINNIGLGSLVLDKSTLLVKGRNNKLLSTNNFTNLTLKEATLITNDYNYSDNDKINNNDPTLATINILGNSIIKNTGGGIETYITNPITINKDSTLNIIWNSKFMRNYNINSKISGTGNINLDNKYSWYQKNKILFYNNLSDFTGTMTISSKDTTGFKIDADNLSDRTLNFKLKSKNNSILRNMSDKSLVLKDISEFTGEILADHGDIILDGEKALNTTAKAIWEQNGHSIILSTNDNIATNKLTIQRNKQTENHSLKKIGTGNLTLLDGVKILNIDTFDVQSGTLTIKTHNEEAMSNNNSSYNFNVNKNATIQLAYTNPINDLKANINGKGNLAIAENTNIETKLNKLQLTGYINLKNNAKLTIKANQLATNLSSELKGSGTFGIDTENENNLLIISGNLAQFTGNFEFSHKNSLNKKLGFNINNANIKNKFLGTGEIINRNTSKLTLEDISEFSGKIIAEEGDIELKGDNSLSPNNIVLVDIHSDKKLFLNTEEKNIKLNNLDIISDNIYKQGSGKLILINDLDKVKNLNIVQSEINLNYNGKVSYNIIGNGDIGINNTNTITIQNEKLKNSGNLILSGIVNLELNKNNILNPNITGNGILNIITSNNSHTELNMSNKTRDFNGKIINPKNNTLTFNNNHYISNIYGSGIVENIGANNMTFDNLGKFNGIIRTNGGDITVTNNNIDDGNYEISNGNMKFNINTNTQLINASFKNNSKHNYFEKLGRNTTLTINDIQAENMKNIHITEGAVIILKSTLTKNNIHTPESSLASFYISHTNINENNTDTNITNINNLLLNNSTSITTQRNLDVTNLYNEGRIELGEHNLNTDIYNGSTGIVELDINPQNEDIKRLTVLDPKTNVNVKLNIDKDIYNKLKYKSLMLATVKNKKKINIINLDKINKLGAFDLTLIENKNNFSLQSTINPNTLGLLNILSQIDSINAIDTTENLFRQAVGIKYIHSNIIDNKYQTYPTATNTLYKNKTIANGVIIEGSYNKKVNNFDLSPIFEVKKFNLNTKSTLKGINNIVSINSRNKSIGIGLGIKYKDIYTRTNIIYNMGTILKDNTDYKYNTLETGLYFGLIPTYKQFSFINEYGISYHPLISESLTKYTKDNINYITHINPYSLRTKLGIKYNTHLWDIELTGKLRYNLGKLKLVKNNDILIDKLNDKLEIALNAKTVLKITKNIRLSLEQEISKKYKSTQLTSSIGISYNW